MYQNSYAHYWSNAKFREVPSQEKMNHQLLKKEICLPAKYFICYMMS